MMCVAAVKTKATSAYTTDVTTSYRTIDLSLNFNVHKKETLRCPFCGRPVTVVVFPKLTFKKALQVARGSIRVFVISAILSVIFAALFFIFFKKDVSAFGRSLYVSLLVSLLVSFCSFGSAIKTVYIALRNAVVLEDAGASVDVDGDVACLSSRAQILKSMGVSKHRMIPNRQVHVTFSEYFLDDRSRYY